MQETPAVPVETKAEYNPLEEAVNEKSYAIPGNNFTPEQLAAEIPEPTYTPPPSSPDEPFMPDDNLKQKKKEDKPFNPGLNDMSESDKARSGEQLADMIMVGYGKLHTLANQGLKVPEKKINRMQMRGEIDLTVAVPYNLENDFVQLGDFLKEFNAQAEQTLVLEPEFVDTVKPPLARVLAKKGYGLTDEQTLLFMFGQDIIFKGMKFTQMKQQTNEILKFARQQTEAGRSRPQQPVTQPMPQQARAAPPPQSMAPENSQETSYEPTDYATGQPTHTSMAAPTSGIVPIQDHILSAHGVAPGAGELPSFGAPGKLKKMEQLKKQDERREKKEQVKTKPVPSNIPNGVRKRGRKPGSKNRKKNNLGL